VTTGTVKFYNAVKGYGLITPAAGRNTIFVQEAMVLGSGLERLSESQKIEFQC
jgi:CspA family cold shock protein